MKTVLGFLDLQNLLAFYFQTSARLKNTKSKLSKIKAEFP